MKNRTWLSIGDLIDLKYKIGQKGISVLLSKLRVSGSNRTFSKWNSVTPGADFWIIPEVRKRWNEKCTGDPDLGYEDYVIEKYFKDRTGLRLLSVGCGTGQRERNFAKHKNFGIIDGVDIAGAKLEEAGRKAAEENFSNIRYHNTSFNNFEALPETYDIIVFHSSLHHFDMIDELMRRNIMPLLKNDGLLVIFEYAGPRRLQWTTEQLIYTNLLLEKIPVKYRTKLNSRSVKRKVYRPGWIRMCLNDPSEAVESDMILPIIHKYFKTVEEKHVGWDILHSLLKDISHNFISDDPETKSLLSWLFSQEDQYMLTTGRSDAIFGIYRKM